MVRTYELAGGPSEVSRRMLEHWRGQQGDNSSLQVAIRAGDRTVHADKNVLIGWRVASIPLKRGRGV